MSRVKFCKVGGGVFHGDPFSPPGFLFERFSKDNISNVFGRIVQKSGESGHENMAVRRLVNSD